MSSWSERLSEYRKTLKESEMIEGYSRKEGMFLTGLLEEQEKQIDKMKCCGNCKHCMYLDGYGYKCGLEEASLFDVREVVDWCEDNWEPKEE